MALARLACKLQSGVKSCFGPSTMFSSSYIRRLSRSTAPPETCYIMGRYGKIPLSGKRWGELGDVLQHRPILESVPSEWYGFVHDMPYKTNDPSRYLLRSGLFLPYFANKLGRSYSGAFRRGNVGVIKDLGLLAFRELNEDMDGKWVSNPTAGYHECRDFLNDVISWRHPFSAGFLPKDMDNVFHRMGRHLLEEDFLIYHAAFMTDHGYDYLVVELWKIIRQRWRQIHKGKWGRDVLLTICMALPDVLVICQDHPILNQFLYKPLRNPAFILDPTAGGVPSGGPINSASGPTSGTTGSGGGGDLAAVSASAGSANPSPIGDSGNTSLPKIKAGSWLEEQKCMGILIVDAHRHGSVHSDEPHLRDLLKFLPGDSATKLKNVPLGRFVIQLLRYRIPMYLPIAFEAVWNTDRNEWEKLGLRRIIPIPTIYFADGDCVGQK